jgi:hypothetical protein
MSLEIDISEPHESMMAELQSAHGEEFDDHLRRVVEAEIHESYQQLRADAE